MNKREKLAQVAQQRHARGFPWEVIIDDVLDELMEPGEGAKLVGARSIGKTMGYENHTERSKDCFQAMITAIREGK